MIKVYPNDVTALLKLISDPEDRKAVQKFLNEVINSRRDKSGNISTTILKRKSAKNALNIICRVVLEIGKHEVISEFLNLFD